MFLTRIINNPTLIGWIALAALVLGLTSGASGAWYLQSLRFKAVQAEYAEFVAKVKADGEAATKEAEAKAAEDKLRKESSDHVYEITIDALRADNDRLLNDRARSGYVSAAPTSSRHPELACFDRAELERALQQFDAEVTRIIDEGSEGTVALNSVKVWAQGIKR